MILTDMLYKPGFDYIKLEPFTGSYQGMRYRIWTEEEKIFAAAYPDEVCFEKTPDEKKTIKEFAFSKEGLDEAVAWLGDEQEKYKL